MGRTKNNVHTWRVRQERMRTFTGVGDDAVSLARALLKHVHQPAAGFELLIHWGDGQFEGSVTYETDA